MFSFKTIEKTKAVTKVAGCVCRWKHLCKFDLEFFWIAREFFSL